MAARGQYAAIADAIHPLFAKGRQKPKSISKFVASLDPEQGKGSASGDSRDAAELRKHIEQITGLVK